MKKIYVLVSFTWDCDSCDAKAFNTHDEAYQQMKAEFYDEGGLDESIPEDEVEDNLEDYDCAYIGENSATLANDCENLFWEIKEVEV